MQLNLSAAFLGLLSLSHASPVLKERQACANAGISAARAQQVVDAFRNARITTQVIPSFQPKVEVNVAYGAKRVDLGNTFSTVETLLEPTITFTGETDVSAATTRYTIIFIDPDAPGPTPGGQPALLGNFLHLLVVDASPNCITPANNGGGSTRAMYKPLTPLSLPSHRYIQLVYRQPPGFVASPQLLSFLAGPLFDVNRFAAQGGLTLVGGNYFLQGLGSVIGGLGR